MFRLRRRRAIDDPADAAETEGGVLEIRWEGESVFLTGPAEITAHGEFYYSREAPIP